MKVFILLCLIIMPFAYGEYKVQSKKMTWTDAEKDCVKWGGHLASITSKGTNDEISLMIEQSGLKEAWIGYNDIEKEGSFKWTINCGTFTNFNQGEPNNLGNEDCVEIVDGTRGGKSYHWSWNDKSCNHVLPSVCQKVIKGNNEYKVVSKNMNWTDAEGKCVKWGGHLASITSKATNKYIALLLKEYGLKEAWIGYNDIEKEGRFEWTIKSGIFNNFNDGEPNNLGNEDCVEMLDGTRGGKRYHWSWNDKSCNHVRPSVCQKCEMIG